MHPEVVNKFELAVDKVLSSSKYLASRTSCVFGRLGTRKANMKLYRVNPISVANKTKIWNYSINYLYSLSLIYPIDESRSIIRIIICNDLRTVTSGGTCDSCLPLNPSLNNCVSLI